MTPFIVTIITQEKTQPLSPVNPKILHINNLHNKTVFLLGNHDSRSDIYAWKLLVKTSTELVLDISLTRRLFLLHGNNCGLEPWTGKKTLTKEDILAIRKKINYHRQISDSGEENAPKEKVLVRPQDLVGIGHLHTIGIVNLDLNFLAVPSLRKSLKDFPSGKFGCVGLIGYGTEWEPDEWDIKIDQLLIQKTVLNY